MGENKFLRGPLRTRVMRESEADGIAGWLRPRMKGDGEAAADEGDGKARL